MLSGLGWIYGKIINKRNSLYKKGSLKSRTLGVPTISVGNITVGGTGKTPLVAYVAEVLAKKGEKVCVISRGYKRKDENKRVLVSDAKIILSNVAEAGDEPIELAEKLIGKAYVVADANRVEAGLWVREKFRITAFVLDDAFQHLKVQRDLNIVTIDATNPFGNEKTLPAGILREPLENLKRADVFVITRANLIEDVKRLKRKIRHYNETAPILSARNKTSELTGLKEPFDTNKNDCYFAFCALGNPDNFFDQLVAENFDIVGTKKFPDHHSYSQKDIEDLEKQANDLKAKALITTAKDGVKLSNLKFSLPCGIAHSEISFDQNKKLRELINAVFDS